MAIAVRTPDGVALSEPDAAGQRTATLDPGAVQRFMRLLFSMETN